MYIPIHTCNYYYRFEYITEAKAQSYTARGLQGGWRGPPFKKKLKKKLTHKFKKKPPGLPKQKPTKTIGGPLSSTIRFVSTLRPVTPPPLLVHLRQGPVRSCMIRHTC